ncbi:protein kinase domain-containing protein [Citrus sinensis]|uniref:cyclin-dependent kinase F-4-like n=1 Tax=Citrus sinensis TaxID=2711 RepID=UPI0021913F35|nr:cyclin-dependent kinase F-4-like [Citrus sinensis]KAH9727341.1 protein kinase domain-containing protein [Citrus sinensis]
MEKYSLTKKLGSGSFGCVWQAVNKHSGEVVAIKALKKSYSREKCLNLREVKCLRKLNHPNFVKVKELIVEKGNVLFVFECMQCNLYQLMEAKKQKQQLFSESAVKAWLFQVFRGLDYVHQQGYFHRDLKPENLLVSQGTIKIADFGLAREIDAFPPYTERVGTRWYQAPEILFKSGLYSSKVDMWAMGAIMAELLLFRPLFQGTDEADQMYKICSVLGSPTMNSWADGLRQAMAINYQFPQLSGVNLSALMPSASEDAINLIESLCSWDPCKRPTAAEALQHPFFKRCLYVPPHLRSTPAVAATRRGMLKQQGDRIDAEALPYPKIVKQLSPLDIMTAVQQNSAAGRKGQQSLANKAIAANRQPMGQMKLPSMKAGVQWNAESRDWFLGPFQNLEPGRIYNEKFG